MSLSWTPVRKGAVYCSPGCGFKCKWADYEQAHINAGALVEELGEGWVPRVWENCSWHYAAETPDKLVKVHVGYTVFVSTEPSAGGKWVGKGDTAKAALADALTIVQHDVDAAIKALDAIRNSIGRVG